MINFLLLKLIDLSEVVLMHNWYTCNIYQFYKMAYKRNKYLTSRLNVANSKFDENGVNMRKIHHGDFEKLAGMYPCSLNDIGML
jgi:hypothetical protein